MYFGSVRFFKHIIVVAVVVTIMLLTGATIRMITLSDHYKKRVEALEVETAQLEKQKKVFSQDNDPIYYQTLFPDLYVEPAHQWSDASNTVYLTFDDGPSERTAEVLDVLKEKDIKATFFVCGKEGEKEKELMQRIVNEGHVIGIHTYSHNYKEIYASVEDYLTDFEKIYQLIYTNTGVKPELFRFPGGSVNIYNGLICNEISSEMVRRGFTYYDWNASNGDTSDSATENSIFVNTITTVGSKDKVILLMHDSYNEYDTVQALPRIIDTLKSEGYQFEKITRNVKPIAFNYSE